MPLYHLDHIFDIPAMLGLLQILRLFGHKYVELRPRKLERILSRFLLGLQKMPHVKSLVILSTSCSGLEHTTRKSAFSAWLLVSASAFNRVAARFSSRSASIFLAAEPK